MEKIQTGCADSFITRRVKEGSFAVTDKNTTLSTSVSILVTHGIFLGRALTTHLSISSSLLIPFYFCLSFPDWPPRRLYFLRDLSFSVFLTSALPVSPSVVSFCVFLKVIYEFLSQIRQKLGKRLFTFFVPWFLWFYLLFIT